MARDIAVNVAPMSAALSKRLLWDSAIHSYTPRQVASLETQLHHRVMGTADAREGVAAFVRSDLRGSARGFRATGRPCRSREDALFVEPLHLQALNPASATPRLEQVGQRDTQVVQVGFQRVVDRPSS